MLESDWVVIDMKCPVCKNKVTVENGKFVWHTALGFKRCEGSRKEVK